jgi:hypothetical protein
VDRESEGSTYLRKKLPNIRGVKMKEGIFVGAQITKLFEDKDLVPN